MAIMMMPMYRRRRRAVPAAMTLPVSKGGQAGCQQSAGQQGCDDSFHFQAFLHAGKNVRDDRSADGVFVRVCFGRESRPWEHGERLAYTQTIMVDETTETLATLWQRNSALWQQLASPLRPSAEDVGLYQKALKAWRSERGEMADRILLLGVTQELRGMDWPADAELVSCDHSRPMIDNLWHCAAFPGVRAMPVCADWQAMPLRNTSRNVAIGDGWASMLAPNSLRRVISELHRVLEPGGLLVTRLYLFPECAENPADIATAALAGEMRSFHAFKWRFAMAVQGGATEQGVRLADIWNTFTLLLPDRSALSSRTGWSLETIATIDSYCGAQGRYYYHRLDTYLSLLESTFEIASIDQPGYELGERCPVIATRHR